MLRQRFPALGDMVGHHLNNLLNFLPKSCELANCSLPLSFSPSLLGKTDKLRASSISLTSSWILSSVFVTKHSLSPDCFKSSWTPSTLQSVLKSNNLFFDILHPRRENKESTQNSTCFDSLLLARQRKSSKYTDHNIWRRAEPTFHKESETLRKAVTDAIDPKGKTNLGQYTLFRLQVGNCWDGTALSQPLTHSSHTFSAFWL